VFIGIFAFEIQGLGPKGFCSSIMETTLYEKIKSGLLTVVEQWIHQNLGVFVWAKVQVELYMF
jgi:hypothetical protein